MGLGRRGRTVGSRTYFFDGSITRAFMLLCALLFAPGRVVRPVVSAGESARHGIPTCLHASWCVRIKGAPHPSYTPLARAREATICAALAETAAREGLQVVPMGLFD